MPTMWIAGGVTGAQKDDDDIPQNMMSSEKFVTVIGRIFDITHGNDSYFSTGFNTGDTSMFLKGNSMFNDITPFNLIKLRGMEIDFGILPYPKLDEFQENYYTRIEGCELFFTAKSASESELERTSVILEAMASESIDTVVPAYYELMLKTKLARDEESEQIIDLVFSHRVFDLVDNLWVVEIRNDRIANMFNNKNNTIVSLSSSLEGIFNSKRDAMVDAFLALDN